MKIVIVGIGKLGDYLTKLLVKENNEVTIIDRDFTGKEELINNEDINYLEGDGLDSQVLMEAGIANTDLLITSMKEDSENIICALLGNKLGAKHTIARIRDNTYNQNIPIIKEALGLSMAVNPAYLTAVQIAQIISIPNALNATTFLKGKMDVITIKLKEDSKLNGMTIRRLSEILDNKLIVCAVERDEDVIIPRGDTKFQEGDRVHVAGVRQDINTFLKFAKLINDKTKSVMIIGASKSSEYLAKMLTDMNMNVTIIDEDEKRCKTMSEHLDNCLIINADPSDQDVLYEEGIEECDSFVSLSGYDENNIVYSMFAKEVGVPKIITKINHINLDGVAKKAEIDSAIAPHKVAANQIVKYVRAMDKSMSSSCDAIYNFDDVFEIVEFKVKENFTGLGKKIRDIQFKDDILIGAIQRGKNIIYPDGNDIIKKSDVILVVTKNNAVKEVNDMVR